MTTQESSDSRVAGDYRDVVLIRSVSRNGVRSITHCPAHELEARMRAGYVARWRSAGAWFDGELVGAIERNGKKKVWWVSPLVPKEVADV